MKDKEIIFEVEKRTKIENDGYELIGPELKRRRVSQSQTLSAVASNVCSVSYLCKVEKSQLKPNKLMLNEICKKLNIDTPKINVLFQMNQIINGCVIAFINNNLEDLEKLYNRCKGFDNYKTQIVKFIYYIAQMKLMDANLLVSELLKITNLMKNYELIVFGTFYSIFLYYQESYLEAVDNLVSLTKMGNENNVNHLVYEYLFRCYFKLNHPYSFKYAEYLIKYYFDKTDFNKVDYYRYLLGIFYINNKMFSELEKLFKILKNEIYLTSLKFICDLKQKKKTKPDFNKLRPMMKLVFYKIYIPEEYRSEFHKIDLKVDQGLDFDYNIAEYMAITDYKDAYNELLSIYIPNALKSKDEYEKQYFISEFCNICISVGRYKNFALSYMEMIKEDSNI